MDQAIVPYVIPPQPKKPKPSRKRPRIKTQEDDDIDFKTWKIRKTLTKSDLNGLSRLIIPSDQVKTYVLPFMTLEKRQMMELPKGISVQLFDSDTRKTHTLTFKKWKSKSYVLISNWNMFALSRELEVNDEIGMTWEKDEQRFNFKVLKRAPRHPPPPSSVMLFGCELNLELTLKRTLTNVITTDQNGVIDAKPLQCRSSGHNSSTTNVIRPQVRRFKSVPQHEIDSALEAYAQTVKFVLEGKQSVTNDVEKRQNNPVVVN